MTTPKAPATTSMHRIVIPIGAALAGLVAMGGPTVVALLKWGQMDAAQISNGKSIDEIKSTVKEIQVSFDRYTTGEVVDSKVRVAILELRASLKVGELARRIEVLEAQTGK